MASAFVDFVYCVSMSLNALKIVKYKIITAVLLQHVSPFPRNYSDLHPHPRSVTVRPVPITAEYPRLPRYYRDPHPHAAFYRHTSLSLWIKVNGKGSPSCNSPKIRRLANPVLLTLDLWNTKLIGFNHQTYSLVFIFTEVQSDHRE